MRELDREALARLPVINHDTGNATAKPILIGIVGTRQSGRDTIARQLKRDHGFACAAFEQPAVDAMYSLYGLSPLDVLDGGKDRALPQFGGLSARELAEALGAHARERAGRDILIRRLVNRAIARGDWLQRDFVITDLREPEELAWLRQAGGIVWWIRRIDSPTTYQELAAVQNLMLEGFDHRDCVVMNHGSLDELRASTEQMLCRTRTVLEQHAAELSALALHN
jgi:hypothetical protein